MKDAINDIKDKVFKRQLREAAASIKADANGKTCGECKHYRESWCADQKSISGMPITILYPTAVACKEFSAPYIKKTLV